MHNSPGTPIGAILPMPSRITIWVFAIGRPKSMGPAPCFWASDQIVVSVGPYMFHTSPGPRSSASFWSSASPPHRILSPFGSSPVSINMRHNAGVACIMVVAERRINAMRRDGSMMSARLAITSSAPAVNGKKISRAAISKHGVVTARKTSVAPMPGACRIAVNRFTTERCSISMPFGRPVEPEVKIR